MDRPSIVLTKDVYQQVSHKIDNRLIQETLSSLEISRYSASADKMVFSIHCGPQYNNTDACFDAEHKLIGMYAALPWSLIVNDSTDIDKATNYIKVLFLDSLHKIEQLDIDFEVDRFQQDARKLLFQQEV